VVASSWSTISSALRRPPPSRLISRIVEGPGWCSIPCVTRTFSALNKAHQFLRARLARLPRRCPLLASDCLVLGRRIQLTIGHVRCDTIVGIRDVTSRAAKASPYPVGHIRCNNLAVIRFLVTVFLAKGTRLYLKIEYFAIGAN
jgi:hypothetical protein